MRLDLHERRTLGDLVGLAFSLFGAHLSVFLTLSLIVVAPVVILVDGVWGRTLAEGGDADPGVAATIASLGLGVVVVPPLVTALSVTVVRSVARGEDPTVGRALRAAGPRLLPAVATVVLYTLGVIVGFALLVVPGIWLSVRWYFGAQAAVVDGLSPPSALAHSADLVRGSWWRTFGRLLAFGLLVAVLEAIGGAVVGALHDGVLYTTGRVLLQTVTLSLSAIFATLVFFDLRARRLPPEGTPPIDRVTPERPIQS